MDHFVKDRCGQRWKPILSNIPLFCFTPCALHIRLNLTKLFFRVIVVFFSSLPVFHSFLDSLHSLSLQFFPHFYRTFQKTDSLKKLAKIRLIGRDCDQLEKHLGALLEHARDTLSDKKDKCDVLQLELLWLY